jgi:hypothetical protein
VTALPVPNPNPGSLRILLAGDADSVVAKIYTPAMVLVLVTEATLGTSSAGWVSLPLPQNFRAHTANGLYYYRIVAVRGGSDSAPAVGKSPLTRQGRDPYFEWLGLPGAKKWFTPKPVHGLDFMHVFLKDLAGLEPTLSAHAGFVAPNGMLWASWRKGKLSDIGDREVRAWALANAWVDVKVCAVSGEWSGLKLVRRKTPPPLALSKKKGR